MIKSGRSKKICYILALFLGGLGMHLFYAKRYKRGTLYLLFCWTYVPIFLGWIDILFINKWFNDEGLIELNKSEKEKILLNNGKNIAINSEPHNKFLTEACTIKDKFYSSENVILPKYAHLKTPKYILDFLDKIEKRNKNKKEIDGIIFEVSVSTGDSDFAKDSFKYRNTRGTICEFKPLFKYWTTFGDLDTQQRKWYFYWRDKALNGEYLNTDLSYIFLFVYELLNYTFNREASFNASMLERLYENYKDIHCKLGNYIPRWLGDFLYELGEEELAKQWYSYETKRMSKLYENIVDNEKNLEKVSFILWKPFIKNYRETEFFKMHKNKIYNTFKKGIALLNEVYNLEENSLLNKWYNKKEIVENRYLFSSSVIARNTKNIEVKMETYIEKNVMYDEITALFRLSENIVRYINGEKREIKVNEDILPENFRELLIENIKKTSHNKKIKDRFKLVQESGNNSEGISIPKPNEENSNKEKLHFDMNKINMLNEQSEALQNIFREKGYEDEEENTFNLNVVVEEDKKVEDNTLKEETLKTFELTDVDEDIDGFIKALSEIEVLFLQQFENFKIVAAEANKYFKSHGVMAGTFINNINEKANEYLDDNIIEVSGECYEIYEEYGELMSIIKGGKTGEN